MMYILFCMLLHTVAIGTVPFFAQSKAVSAANAGDHAKAQQLLNQALVASPHDPVLLYDAGVAACKLAQYELAAGYFEKASVFTEKADLKEEALFNAGNAYAHQKRYDDAIKNYEKILTKNPNHERARYNYEQVKKLKEQEEQQQDQQQNGDDNKQNQHNKQDQNQKQQNQDNKDSAKSDNDNAHNGQEGQHRNNHSDQSNHDDDLDQSNDPDDAQEHDEKRDGDSDSDQKQNNQRKQENQPSSKPEKQQQQQGNKKQYESSTQQNSAHQEKDRDYNNQREQSGDKHPQPSEKQEPHKAQSKASASTEQASVPQERDAMPAELEGADKQWMRCALEACDKQDSKHNKQLLKAVVGTDKGDSRAVRSSW